MKSKRAIKILLACFISVMIWPIFHSYTDVSVTMTANPYGSIEIEYTSPSGTMNLGVGFSRIPDTPAEVIIGDILEGTDVNQAVIVEPAALFDFLRGTITAGATVLLLTEHYIGPNRYYIEDGRWMRLHRCDPKAIFAGDMDGNGRDETVIDFGSAAGLWTRYDDGRWRRLHPRSP